MTFRLVKQENKNCKILWLILILFVCICLVINYLYKNRSNEFFDTTLQKQIKKQNPQQRSFNLGVCSKNCCATQWQVPIDVTEKSKIKQGDIGSNLIRSNLTCNNGITNSGCVCLTKESKQLLGNRGYQKQLPMSNGLLNSDNKQSVWQLIDNTIDKPLVLGQNTQLTGNLKDKSSISGNLKDKTSKQQKINDEKNIIYNYTIPINNNMINWDNDEINNSLLNIDTKKSKTDKLLDNPLGMNTASRNIK